MKKHTKIYLQHFGYGLDDYIPSEISGKPAQGLHHIIYKGQQGKDEIENLMAVTSEEHERLHFITKPYIREIEAREMHLNFLHQYEQQTRTI